MDSFIDLQQPDEARPAKRIKLDGSLDITEDVQEETIDDDDWDDIYGTSVTPAIAQSPDGGVPFNPIPGSDQADAPEVESKDEVGEGLPAEVVDDGDELVIQGEHLESTDEPSARMLEETAQIETGPAHKDQHLEERVSVEAIPENKEEILEEDETGQHPDKKSNNDDVEESDEQTVERVESLLQEEAEHTDPEAADASISREPKVTEDPEFLAAAAAQKQNQAAEWQFNSSDVESSDSDSDSSSDGSDDSESGSEGGYEMLDPETAAKILMSGDGDDEDGEKGKNQTGDHQPRTTNEVKEVVVPKPDVVVTEDMKITLLGTVERTVETIILLIKAVTPGEFQVLESGSVLCNEKREVIGAVAETLGKVQEPMYSVAFTNTKEIEELGLEFGAKVFYVDSHSSFVFTQPLKNLKGTDASNIHDEEVGEDELEFSDDEAEAEYKRQKKLAKRGGRGGLSRGAFDKERAARSFGAPDYDGGPTYANGSDAPQQQYGGGLSYDDGDAQDEFYRPLKRPDNLSQLMAGGGLPPRPPQGNFDRGRGRGRGDRGRGRGDRGRGRGGFDRNQRGGRGGQAQDRGSRGGYGQQNGHRGAAHSFPDRHNNEGMNGYTQHSSPPGTSGTQSSPTPPVQQSHTGYQQYSPQASNQQTYQFNGYQFQYGNPPPQPPASQTGYYNQAATPQSPTGPIPPGAYVNPALFQAQQLQSQWAQPQQQQATYGGWQNPQQAQQFQNAQPGQGLSSQQQNNLADILRQFGGQQPR